MNGALFPEPVTHNSIFTALEELCVKTNNFESWAHNIDNIIISIMFSCMNNFCAIEKNLKTRAHFVIVVLKCLANNVAYTVEIHKFTIIMHKKLIFKSRCWNW